MGFKNNVGTEGFGSMPIQLRTKEVANVLGVSLSTAKEWIRSGELKSYSIRTMRFVAMEDAIAFVERYRSESKQGSKSNS